MTRTKKVFTKAIVMVLVLAVASLCFVWRVNAAVTGGYLVSGGSLNNVAVNTLEEAFDKVNNAPTGNYQITVKGNDTATGNRATLETDRKVVLSSEGSNNYTLTSSQTDLGHILVKGTLEIKNLTLDGDGIGGGLHVEGGTVVIREGTKITNCFNGGYGAITLRDNAHLTMEGGVVSDSKTDDVSASGGGVDINNSTFIMNGGAIQNNDSLFGGGVDVSYYGKFIMNGGTIEDNRANYSGGFGGGIHVFYTGYFEMNGGVIQNNESIASNGNGLAGGIYVGGGSHVSGSPTDTPKFVMKGGTIKGNRSYMGGGIASYLKGDIQLLGGSIVENEATYGGGVFMGRCHEDNDITLKVEGNIIKDNMASDTGGGMYLYRPYFTVGITIGSSSAQETVIEGNVASVTGGGMYLAGKDSANTLNIPIENTLLKDNVTTTGDGAGIYINNYVNATISNSKVTGNQAQAGKGGGIYIHEDAVLAVDEDSEFKENTAYTEGGAIFTNSYDYQSPADITKYQNVTIDATTKFKDNRADGLYNPPSNKDDFTNLNFVSVSNAQTHILNNYDVNYLFGTRIVQKTVTYLANGGDGGPYTVTVNEGATHEVLPQDVTGITRQEHVFTGWNTQSDGSGDAYSKADPIVVNNDITLYAQWEQAKLPNTLTYKVTYLANGGLGGPHSVMVNENTTHDVLALNTTGISREGYTFTGWNTQANGSGTAYSVAESFVVNSDITLYAQWKKESVKEQPNPPKEPTPTTPDNPSTPNHPNTPTTSDSTTGLFFLSMLFCGSLCVLIAFQKKKQIKK